MPGPRKDGANRKMDSGHEPRVPRWVLVFGFVAIVVLAVTIVAMLVVGGQHGPGRHLSSPGATTTSPLLPPVHQGRVSGNSWSS